MAAAGSLKYGDVIRFQFCGEPVTAMVLLARVSNFVETDEGTSMMPDENGKKVVVLGLVNDDDESGEFHKPSQTATVILDGYDIEVLR